MAVPSSIADLSTTAASNSPAGAESIGTSLDDYLRAIQSIVKQQDSRGTDIASAGTVTVPNAGSYFVVTGTTSITAINDNWNGRTVALKFSDALTLTHSSGLILPGAANITTAASDTCLITNESAGVWRVIGYQKASGVYLTSAAIGVTVQAYDADTAKTDVAQTFTLPQRGTITTDNDGSFDLDVTNFWLCTPTAGFTLTFTNIPAAGQGGFIKLVNGSNYAVAAHANTKVTSSFLATVSVTGTYIINYVSDGTNVHCSTAGASA